MVGWFWCHGCELGVAGISGISRTPHPGKRISSVSKLCNVLAVAPGGLNIVPLPEYLSTMDDEGVNAVWVLTSWTGRGTICAGEMVLPKGLTLFIISKMVYGQSNVEIYHEKQLSIINDI